ncbi:uncharacterized protein LOC132256187 [Phlebotomus argentipes]|uniref:uncharacterized protein LOC132256187 n=1 Tax=Phlebotomus argentipes TaxID=94469 RepID=UPI002892D2DD|nr:uncharacterized protein LOC132256187 [Phlebotomus argentipes]
MRLLQIFLLVLQLRMIFCVSSWWYSYAFANSWSYAPIAYDHPPHLTPAAPQQRAPQTASSWIYDPQHGQWIYRSVPEPMAPQQHLPAAPKPFLFANSMAMANIG